MNLTPSATEQMLQLIEEQIKCFARMKELQDQIMLLNERANPQLVSPPDKCDVVGINNSANLYKISLDEKGDHLLMMLDAMQERALEFSRPATKENTSKGTAYNNRPTRTPSSPRETYPKMKDGVILENGNTPSNAARLSSAQDLIAAVDNLSKENEEMADEIHEIELCTEQIQARIHKLETWLTNRRRKENCEWADRGLKCLQINKIV